MIRKLTLLIAVIGGFLMTACEEQDIMVFGEERMVYFEKFWRDAIAGTETADSTLITFYFNHPTDMHQQADLIGVLAGRKVEKDTPFRLRVVDELTTALPEDYTLEDEYIFRAMPVPDNATSMQDTIHIQFNRTPHLDEVDGGYRLVLEIVPTEEMKVGQYERSRAIIWVSKEPVRPLWWNEEVETYLLGKYSPLKYKLFLENVEGAEDLNENVIKEQPDLARKLVMKFKEWLIMNPTYEDGILIDVPL